MNPSVTRFDSAGRAAIVQEYQRLTGDGFSKGEALLALHITESTIRRWTLEMEMGDKKLTAAATPKRRGRPPVFNEETLLNDEVRGYLQRLTLKTSSEAMAIQLLAAQEFCPPKLKTYIDERSRSRCGRFAPSLHRACKTSSAMKAKLRGPKAMEYDGYSARRGREMVMPDGSKRVIEPGDLLVFDDMSWNQPFWFELDKSVQPELAMFPLADWEAEAYRQKGMTRAGTGEALARKHQVAMGRQSLMAMDHASGRLLGIELVARPKDAYRAEDILRFLSRLIEEYGLPRWGVRFERGIWRSRIIDGVGNKGDWSDAEGPLCEGIRALGIEIHYAWKTGQKGEIETGFDHLQDIAAGLLEHRPNIGKKRGEMERETSLMLRCKAGVVHPRDVGFPHVEELLGEAVQCMDKFNGKMKRGQIQQGIPDERWNEAIAAAPLRRLDPMLAWVFAPRLHQVEIREGVVSMQVDGEKYRFVNPEEFALLGNGYRVAVRFDPAAPEKGAWIFNREVGARSFHGYGPGALICAAEQDELAPQLGGEGSSDIRKRWNAALRDCYSATGLWKRRKYGVQQAGAPARETVQVSIAAAQEEAKPAEEQAYVDPIWSMLGGGAG